MTNRLAENIRVFRKERGLTQEQLAEVLGVTVGAVYKWEAKLSLPELSLIMELADFFDTSVDVLLGYEMKDNRLRATVERLKDYAYRKDRAGLAEAEKALKKYPNAFDVVYHAARMDLLFSVENRDRALLRRGLERYEAARRLLSQNTDPRISESTICGEMAKIRMLLGETEEALALLKRHNAGGVYDDLIGWMLTACKRPDEALPFLSDALMKSAVMLMRTIMGYTNAYFLQKEYDSAKAILNWGIGVFDGLRGGNTPCFVDKLNGVLLVCLACARLKFGDREGAAEALRCARALAARFDAEPDYRIGALRFIANDRQKGFYDDIGATAMEGVRETVASLGGEELHEIWQELDKNAE